MPWDANNLQNICTMNDNTVALFAMNSKSVDNLYLGVQAQHVFQEVEPSYYFLLY